MQRNAQGHKLRIGRYSEAQRIYLITAVCHQRSPVFSSFARGRSFVRALMATQSWSATYCYVVMPDHIHWLMQLDGAAELSRTVQKVKSLTTIGLRDSWYGPVWQRGFHDRAIRQDVDLQQAARYIVANPLRAGLVESLRNYPLWDAVWV